MWNDEGGTDPDEQNWIGQIDRTNTLGSVLLGSTLACGQCHNHKYDPFLQTDYYAMVAFFNNARFDASAQRKFTEATVELSTPEQAAKRDALKSEIKKDGEPAEKLPEFRSALEGVGAFFNRRRCAVATAPSCARGLSERVDADGIA